MNSSVGVDIVEVERIRQAMENPRFLREFFSQEEREYFAGKFYPEQSAAGAYAAKEAFAKAVGTGIRDFGLQEVSVCHDSLGCPYFLLSGRAAQLYRDWRFSLSISHTSMQAIAFVLAVSPNEQ